MTARKAGSCLGRAILRANGREVRRVRRARWAAQGHNRPMWHGQKYNTPVMTYAQWEYLNRKQNEIDREVRRSMVLSMIASVRKVLIRPFVRKQQTRRHQAR